jgi:hypothetical protein
MKSGGRRLFSEEGVAHPPGAEGVRTPADLTQAISALRAADPSMRRAIVKLDVGVSGLGNAEVELDDLPAPASPDHARLMGERVVAIRPEDPELAPEEYLRRLEAVGGVVEQRIEGDEVRSPSVQMRITPLRALEILSTHDQLLGGASGQSYLGARFPADPAYARLITEEARKIGERLVREGVLGRFAVDFVVVRSRDRWRPYAIELNLRKGGTTHPFLTLQFLTDGAYDPDAAVFTAPSGRPKSFVASDHVESESYRGMAVEDLFDVVVRHRLHFDQSRQTGVVLHMLSSLSEHGRTGVTAVGDSPEEAQALYERTLAALDEEAAAVGD